VQYFNINHELNKLVHVRKKVVPGTTKSFDIIIVKHKRKEIIRKFRLSTGHQRPLGAHQAIQRSVSVVYPSVPLGVTTNICMTTHFRAW